jgi:DNA modification methylase
MDYFNKIINIDCLEGLKQLPDNSIDCCVTSPPYWGLRDYGHDDQIGLEQSPEEYVDKMVLLFGEVKRALKDDGTLWLNLGDSYYNFRGYTDYAVKQSISSNDAHVMNSPCGKRNAKIDGLKGKDLVGIPWMVAFALRADGWYLRQDIIWHKPNPMPESVTDRCTKSHEYIFLLSKSQKYYFDYEAIQEEAAYDGRKDTMMKGGDKYADGEYLANGNANSLSVKGRERWKFKNLQDKGQQTHTIHEKRANGEVDELYAVRNKRDVWTVNTKPFSDAHFATFPEKLIVDMIKAGCPKDGIVLDPFMGSGTTAVVARKLERNYTGFELNQEYIKIAEKRLYNELGMFL